MGLVRHTKYRTFFASLLVAVGAGFVYSFSIYSGAIKQSFSLSQAQVDWVGVVGCLMFPFSPLMGWITDTRGPRTTLLMGGTLMGTGLALQYVVASKRLPGAWAWAETAQGATVLLSICACVTAVGSNAAASVAYATPVRLFPTRRGTVIGLCKAWSGIAGGLMSQIYVGYVGQPSSAPSTLSFLLVLAAVAVTCNVVVAPLIMPPFGHHTYRAGEEAEEAGEAGEEAGEEEERPFHRSELASGSSDSGDSDDAQHFSWTFKAAYGIFACMVALIATCSFLTAAPHTAAAAGGNHSNHSNLPELPALLPAASTGAKLFASAFLVLVAATALVFFLPSRRPARPPTRTDEAQSSQWRALADPLTNPRTTHPHDTVCEAERGGGGGGGGGKQGDRGMGGDNTVRLPDVGLGSVVRSMDCYLLLWAASVEVGAGYFLTTNTFQIIESIPFASASAATAVTIFSASQACGRLAGGLLPEMLLHWTGGQNHADSKRAELVRTPPRRTQRESACCCQVTRPACLAVFCLLTGLGQGLICLAATLLSAPSTARGVLYTGYFFAGIGFGGVWPLMVTIVSERWGTSHLAQNYMFFDGLTAAIGALPLGKFLPQTIYQAHVRHGATACMAGAACFAETQYIIVVASGTSALAAVALAVRMAPLYQRIYDAASGDT